MRKMEMKTNMEDIIKVWDLLRVWGDHLMEWGDLHKVWEDRQGLEALLEWVVNKDLGVPQVWEDSKDSEAHLDLAVQEDQGVKDHSLGDLRVEDRGRRWECGVLLEVG